ncbi:hypothetical protein ANCCAN_25681 [Ancylostoma caninum]|uniref:Uncharacterized protein n=1 Tax=Ancylostoma caninum TaxID=29170 RepID=A0A368FCM4_ANCCA|nr:hypothetical protein ANCCAN_25681 [Ancylostoma caninum]
MLDEVDVVTHIEPITDAIKSLEQKLDLFARSLEEWIDATIQRLEMRMNPRHATRPLQTADNRDAHPTGRCPRYADAIARAVQIKVMGLCTRCLQARHAADCGVRCTICGAEHNMLLCPTRAQYHGGPKLRKVRLTS